MELRESACPVEAVAVRLARRAGRPFILVSTPDQEVLGRDWAEGSSWMSMPFRLHAGSRGLEWDAAEAPDGWRRVTTEPGSSVCRLRLSDRAGEISTRDLSTSRDILRRPRFLRGREDLAVAVDEGDPQGFYLLGRDPAGAPWSRSVPLPIPAASLQAALIVRAGPRFLLLVKSYVQGSIQPGSNGELPHRTLWGFESLLPGTLFCVPLDDDFRPAAPAARLLEDALVYEFDADVLVDRLGLCATTAEGALILAGPVGETLPGGLLLSPAVRVAEGVLHVAAIAGEGRRLLLGERKS